MDLLDAEHFLGGGESVTTSKVLRKLKIPSSPNPTTANDKKIRGWCPGVKGSSPAPPPPPPPKKKSVILTDINSAKQRAQRNRPNMKMKIIEFLVLFCLAVFFFR